MVLLHGAAFLGDQEIVRALLADGADVNARDWDGCTVLMSALGAVQRLGQVGLYYTLAERTDGRPALIALLAKQGAPLDARNRFGDTALNWAIKLRRPDLVRALLAAGANPNVPVRVYRPLELAARDGNLEIVRLLLDANAKVNRRRNGGNTALHLARAGNHLQVVDLLLAAGAVD